MKFEPARRELLAGLGVASAASLVGCATVGHAADTTPPYGFTAGLTYLNTGSLGPCSREVFDATMKAWRDIEENPVSQAYASGPVGVRADQARQRVAAFLGAAPGELTITRSTTDAMNTIASSIVLERGDRVLTTNQEHHGGEYGWQWLQRRRGVELDVLQLALTEHDPAVIVRRFADAITPRTKVLSVSHVFTSTGLRLPIAELAALARARGILCVVDGAQAVGALRVDVHALGCHAYAAPGHKWLMGPKGTGLLYIAADAAAQIEPMQRQDGVQFISNAVGMGAVPLVVGLGVAVDALQAQGMEAVERRIFELREHVFRGLSQLAKLQVVSPPGGPTASSLVAARLPDGVDSKALQKALRERHGVIIKRVEDRYFNGIRLSAHVFNTGAEIEKALAALKTELG